MIFLDTNYLIAVVTPGTFQDQQSRVWLAAGETLYVNIIAWAEFLCGPVSGQQVNCATRLLDGVEQLTKVDAARAADLFNATGRRKGSLADCLIAAMCLRLAAPLATANLADFRRFVPMGLRLA